MSWMQKLREMGELRPYHKLVEEELTRREPELMGAFYPRKYATVGNYHSPKLIGAFLANVCFETAILERGISDAPTAYKLMLPSFRYLIEKKMPLMFIAPQLLEAVKRTSFDGDIDWIDLPLPYDSGIFVLPRGGLAHPTDGECACIMYSRVQAGKYPPPIEGIGLPGVQLVNGAFYFVALFPYTDNPVWLDANFTMQGRRTVKLGNVFYREELMEPLPQLDNSSYLDGPCEEADQSVIEQLGVLVFGTLLALAARPELMTKGRLEKKVERKDRVLEFWSPNVIGKNYQLSKESQGGTHASPRMHWRRGHFRMQVCGHARAERKRIWLEPCLVAAIEDEVGSTGGTK